MSGFLYFLPNHHGTSISPEQIKAMGLAHAFEDFGRKTPSPTANGPGGAHGLMLGDPNRIEPGRTKYAASAQVWEQHGSKGYLVGMWKEDRPTPEQLERADMLPGLPVKLADDREWIVPQARSWSMEDDPEAWPRPDNKLRRRITFDTSGAELGVHGHSVLEKYAELWAISEIETRLAYNEGTEADKQQLSGANLYANTLKILEVNYVLGPVEVNLLGLFDTECFQRVFDALNDSATWLAFMQKKSVQLAASLPSSDLPEDTHQSTAQPVQTLKP